MRIDSHQHFWYFHPGREGWITDDMAAIRKDFLPEHLEPVLRKNNIDGCIAVQANGSEAESQFLLALAADNPYIKGVVGWVDLTAENAGERLAHYAAFPLFKGIRHPLQSENIDFIGSLGFQRGIAELGQFDLSYDLLVLEHQLPASLALVKQFPQQRFVLDHMAKPSISKGVSAQWSEHIMKLGQCPNLYCKVSGFLTETEGFQWNDRDFDPFLETVYRAFGADRLMFGSDWPVCLAAGTYEDSLRILSQFFSKRDEIVLDKIMGRNAIEFYVL